MTTLDEERCRTLVEKLCSRLGWSVRPAPAVQYVLLDRASRWITFGGSMTEVVGSLCDRSRTGIVDPDDLPAWLRGCASPEELAMKIEVML